MVCEPFSCSVNGKAIPTFFHPFVPCALWSPLMTSARASTPELEQSPNTSVYCARSTDTQTGKRPHREERERCIAVIPINSEGIAVIAVIITAMPALWWLLVRGRQDGEALIGPHRPTETYRDPPRLTEAHRDLDRPT